MKRSELYDLRKIKGLLVVRHWRHKFKSVHRFDELKDIIHSLKNSEKIRDVAKVQTGLETIDLTHSLEYYFVSPSAFETLQKAYTKSKSVVDQEGGAPKFYIKALTEVEDFVQKVNMKELEEEIYIVCL